MKLVKKAQTVKLIHNKHCVSFEYPAGDKDINVAMIKLDGRYPEKGYAMNEICKELAFVIKGSGYLVMGKKRIKIGAGDLTFVDPGEKYYWQGKMTMLMPCTPAWTLEQHRVIDDAK